MPRPSAVIPVIDLFAGPGGLCEGFSSVLDASGNPGFDVRVSIEKDPVAHRTLMLRAIFRQFARDAVPDVYYAYVRAELSRASFLLHPEIAEAARRAASEARCAELGRTSPDEIDGWIGRALAGANDWVLIGGPPCQAYSLAGRSRLRGKDIEKFESDERHFLYTEYLRIIRKFTPAVFVMENVKGMLNSTNSGKRIFERILGDLRSPRSDLSYEVRSFVVDRPSGELEPNDYVIQAENYGIPQSRHRVILFGIRSDVVSATAALSERPADFLLHPHEGWFGTKAAIAGLPALRSRLSREADSPEAWLATLDQARVRLSGWKFTHRATVAEEMKNAAARAANRRTFGAPFARHASISRSAVPAHLREWYLDDRLGGVLQHEARSHMRADLHRYLFAASFARVMGYAPNLHDFPPALLPEHVNVAMETIPFKDRFRVQLADRPCTTVVAHIKKDGHYYIHPDPAQCRSLTVREAARIQTFPDNYYFEGTRTEQYGQIGNAVPPFLAHQIGNVVYRVLTAERLPAR